eukprot:gene38587-46911_t
MDKNNGLVGSFLIIHNIAKVNNVLQLIKLAIIYNLTPVIVGCKSFRLAIERALQEGGVMNPYFFDRLEDAKNVLQICIVGIEIDPSAITVQSFQPQNVIPLAFLPGNEGTGLTSSQRRLVDFFVFVPQYGSGTASLNVHVATTLVLQEMWIKNYGLSF